ncbi:MAG: bifunctional adenosylcobinamide kinase/adenosylcobinamide-phosphate guanylyltransferase [Synechococcales cyanobacterium]
MTTTPQVLVLGGTRSGKSRVAEEMANRLAAERVVYVATAPSPDPEQDREMAERIARHQQDRPAGWITAEAPLDLAPAIAPYPHHLILVDCLSLWVANHLLLHPEAQPLSDLETQLCTALIHVIEHCRQRSQSLILVSNEVGMGIVPPYPLGRQYRDLLGRINQQAAQCCDEVYWVMAGIPMPLKR